MASLYRRTEKNKRRKRRIFRRSPMNVRRLIRPINNSDTLNRIARLGPQNVTTQFESDFFVGSVF
jgi:hypothetical protein